MKVGVGIAWEIVVDGQVNALDIDTTAEDVGGDADTLLEVLERLVTLDTALVVSIGRIKDGYATYRSSWLTPECTATDGKLQSFRSLSSSVARRVLLTKMIAWLN
jgi:hypothetical protein